MIEFLIPRRPVSLQIRKRKNLQSWKQYVAGIATEKWNDEVIESKDLRLTLVYICDDSPADIDNIIKPIQDSMVGVIYKDDIQISDVDSHRRYLSDPIEIDNLPDLLVQAIEIGNEAVYVKVSEAENLGIYL